MIFLAEGWRATGFFMDLRTGIAVVRGVGLAPTTGRLRDVELHKVGRKLEITLPNLKVVV